MPLFLDVNVWLPLVWEGHVATESARQWASGVEEDFILCRFTQVALLRHLTNPIIMADDVLSNDEASELSRALSSRPNVLFSHDPGGVDTLFPAIGNDPEPRRNRWTDAYLAAFAIAGNHRLVSFDRGFARYEAHGLRWQFLPVES